ncbi:hypothetical protein F7725_011781, partial [Dissostichus mawsoni]
MLQSPLPLAEGPLPLSSLRLLVPPLRMMTAVMWKVVRLRDIMHYGKVEEFVSLVTEAIPDIFTERQMRLLTLGLRSKAKDFTDVKTHLDSLMPSTSKLVHPGNEAMESNFVKLIQRLLDDPKGREHFLKVMCFRWSMGLTLTQLWRLCCEFFTRLDKLLLIPDFKQTAMLIGDTPSALEESMQCVSKADDLKVLLRSKAHLSQMYTMDTSVPSSSEQLLFSSLSFPPSLPETNAQDLESNTQTFLEQEESEAISLQDALNMEIQDVIWPSEDDVIILESSNAGQTTGGKCSDSVPDALTLEEYDNGASGSFHSPSTSANSPHERTHTKICNFTCKPSGQEYPSMSEMRSNQKSHPPKISKQCKRCGEMFSSVAQEFSVPLSSLALLVPPLRLMSAVMWEVVRQRNIKHYGKLEEFVTMVTDAVPELMSKREGRLLSLGLRARTTLELLRSEHPEDLKAVESHLNRIRTSCIEETNDPVIEAPEANFMKLVQGLIEDTDGREHFLKNVFPVEYGPDFDTALETLVCEFFTRLEELLPIPDFKQTASWISGAPSVLEEYMQCVSNGDDIKFLLQSKQCHGKLAKSTIAPFPPDDLLIPSLSLPPSLEVAISSHPSGCDDENNDVPQIVMFDEELSTNPSTSTDFPESPKRTDMRQSGLHKCPECNKCFKHHSVLTEHQRVHSGLQPYNCSECGRAFRTATLLAGHRLRKCKNAAYLCIKCGNSFPTSLDKFRHHCPKRGRSYDCGHCGKSFQKSSSLKEHLLTHVQSRLFKCSHCGVGFSGIGDLKYHQQVDHDKPYQCKQCGKSFISSKCLTKHQQRHEEGGEMESVKLMSGGKHRKSGSAHRTSSSSMSSRKSSKAAYPRGRVTHNCPLCGRSFKYRFEFLEHQRFHTAVKPYRCSQCGKAFRTEAHLSRHRKRKCKNASHICTKCGCQFRSLHERVRHQCVQLLTKYECSHCGKTFKMAHLLRNHQMSEHQLPYSANHRFRCRYCDETFPGISELKYHQRVDHEKPYQCQECGKCFLSEKCLANHELRHNDDRPESCLVCGRGFRNRYDLKQHMRTHTGERPYQCTHCSQCFSTAGGLRSHTRVHTGEKPHVCPDC